MSRAVREWSDGRSLRATQYRDGRNLSARLELHLRFGTNPQGFHRWVVEQLPPSAGLRALAEIRWVLAPAGWLAAHFGEVRLQLYEDALAVTKVEPLLAYVRSMTLLEAGAAEALRAAVTHAIARDGAFAIRKHAGLFLARA